MEFFITGTDTGIGKTFVTAALAAAFTVSGQEVKAQKWVATGNAFLPEDVCFIKDAVARARGEERGVDDHVTSKECPYRFAFPASPHLAASMEGKVISGEVIKESFLKMRGTADIILVEGVGGIMVPLSEDLLLADLLVDLKIPSIVVAKAGLGTINHTLLTIEYMKKRGITIRGLILNRQYPGEETGEGVEHELIVADNSRIIEKFSGVPVLAVLPHVDDVMDAASALEPVALDLVSQGVK